MKQNSRFLIETWDIEHFFLLKLNKVLGETEGKMGLDIQKKKKKKKCVKGRLRNRETELFP